MASFRVSQAHPELFHYTNAEGLKGILTSQSLWGTNWRYLNDSTEVAYFCEALPSLLTPARMAACELFAREIPGFHAWADEQGGFRALVAKEVLGLTQTFRDSFAHPDPAEQMFEYYVTSFCTPEDSPPEVREHGLLSMWRSYAAGGYAIVFDTEELEALIRAEVGVWQAFMTFSDVGYGCDTPDVLEARISAIPKLREISSRSRLNSEEAFKELLDPLLHCFINYKHWAFAEEREVRLTTILSGEAMPPHHSTDNGKAERDVRWEHGAPRIHLFEGLDRQLPIKRIIVGPGPHQPTRQAELQALLSKLQLDIPVALSNIPLKF